MSYQNWNKYYIIGHYNGIIIDTENTVSLKSITYDPLYFSITSSTFFNPIPCSDGSFILVVIKDPFFCAGNSAIEFFIDKINEEYLMNLLSKQP